MLGEAGGPSWNPDLPQDGGGVGGVYSPCSLAQRCKNLTLLRAPGLDAREL